MAEFNEERANSIVETSLTELAFIFFFILLTVTTWKIKNAADALQQSQDDNLVLSEQVESLSDSLETASAFLEVAGELDSTEIFQELTAGRKAIEKLDTVLADKAKLEQQLTALTDSVGVSEPIDSLAKKLGEYHELINALDQHGLGEGDNPVEAISDLIQQNVDTRGQNINLRNKLKNLGNGLDHPPCWADPETGTIQYVFDVIINEDYVEFKAGWPESRNTQALANPNIINIPGRYVENADMWAQTRALFVESEAQDCRHFVRVYDHAESKAAFKRYLLGVENHFYKFLSSRVYS